VDFERHGAVGDDYHRLQSDRFHVLRQSVPVGLQRWSARDSEVAPSFKRRDVVQSNAV
jgi:hypothetical protein